MTKRKTALSLALICLLVCAASIYIVIQIGKQPLIEIGYGTKDGAMMMTITDADDYIECLEGQQSLHMHGYTGLRDAFDEGMKVLEARNQKQAMIMTAAILSFFVGAGFLWQWIKKNPELGTADIKRVNP